MRVYKVNPVAKHMHKFNRPSVIESKKRKSQSRQSVKNALKKGKHYLT